MNARISLIIETHETPGFRVRSVQGNRLRKCYSNPCISSLQPCIAKSLSFIKPESANTHVHTQYVNCFCTIYRNIHKCSKINILIILAKLLNI